MTDPHPVRCSWSLGDPQMESYHDIEWGVPVHDPHMLWEMLILEGFQAGLSWRTILHRREGFRAAFYGFDPEAVARYDGARVDLLMQNPGIIRARAKIEATIGNARAYLAMRDAGEDFAGFVWSFVDGTPVIGDGAKALTRSHASEALSAALKQRGFKFVGPVIVYAWMQACGLVNDHETCCFRRAGS